MGQTRYANKTRAHTIWYLCAGKKLPQWNHSDCMHVSRELNAIAGKKNRTSAFEYYTSRTNRIYIYMFGRGSGRADGNIYEMQFSISDWNYRTVRRHHTVNDDFDWYPQTDGTHTQTLTDIWIETTRSKRRRAWTERTPTPTNEKRNKRWKNKRNNFHVEFNLKCLRRYGYM